MFPSFFIACKGERRKILTRKLAVRRSSSHDQNPNQYRQEYRGEKIDYEIQSIFREISRRLALSVDAGRGGGFGVAVALAWGGTVRRPAAEAEQETHDG